MKFHHIGIACKDINEQLNLIKIIFPEAILKKPIYDPLQNASLSLIIMNDLTIELISGEPVKNLVEKGMAGYHICFSVSDMKKTITQLINNGAIIVSNPKPAVLFKNKNVAFLHTKLGLIELLGEN
jgi:methylmalonyl-CoA/ethylmalonyl-CoA epimerase